MIEKIPDLDSVVKLANVALVLLSGALVYLTYVLAKEAKKKRLQDMEPHIVVTIEPHRIIHFAELIIENVGHGPAFDVHIVPDPDVPIRNMPGNGGTGMLSGLSLMKIDTLKAQQSIKSFLGKWNEIGVKKTVFSVQCRDSLGSKHKFKNNVDLRVYDSMSTLGSEHQETIARSLKNLSDAAIPVLRGGHRIKIETFNSKDRREENEAFERQWSQPSSKSQASSVSSHTD